MIPWEDFDGKPYTKETFALHLDTIAPERLTWCKFITLHNTDIPSLRQWTASGTSPAQRISNLQHLYRDLDHWHQGPHAFVAPDYIWGFSPFTEPGVHASCFNKHSIGIEMVGDYATEDFGSGLGAKVRDNAVWVLACLHHRIGIRPDGFKLGLAGLHFHKDCKQDKHNCPGPKVDRADVVSRILEAMESFK